MPRLVFVAVLLFLGTPITAQAQIGTAWTFEDRNTKSDLIVIAAPIATKDTGRRTLHPSLQPGLPVIELETEFKVLTTLKGQSAEVIRLKHCRIDVAQVSGGLINAGTELSFDADTKSSRVLEQAGCEANLRNSGHEVGSRCHRRVDSSSASV